jgi:hypothetical protein
VLPAQIDSREEHIARIDPDGWHTASDIAQQKLHEIIECVSVGTGLDWWLSSPPSRNPFISPLHHHLKVICYFSEVWRRGGENGLREIIVDSPALQQILEHLSTKGGSKGVLVVCKDKFRHTKVLLSLLNNMAGHVLRYLILGFPRFNVSSAPRIGVLVDTFILKGWMGGDRYYGGSIGHLSDAEYDTVWQAPEFLSSSPNELRAQQRLLRDSKDNYLFKQAVLTLSDYFFAFRRALSRPRVPALLAANCCGLPVHTLIEEEMARRNGFDQTVRGWLNYRFFKRLPTLGVKPRRIIDWFENQSIDKGWHKGVNEFFPDSHSIGYQGFPDIPSYFCMFPTEAERLADVLPTELAVMGNGYAASRRRYCPELRVVTAPAFRFGHLWRDCGVSFSQRQTILVGLPIDTAVATELLQCVFSLPQNFWQSLGLELRIRPHPASPLHSLGLPEDTILHLEELIDTRPFADAIDNSRVFVGTMSSTCLEALVRHVPVIIFQVPGSDFNTIPPDAPGGMVALFSSGGELEGLIRQFALGAQSIASSTSKDIDSLRARYFLPSDERAVTQFFSA